MPQYRPSAKPKRSWQRYDTTCWTQRTQAVIGCVRTPTIGHPRKLKRGAHVPCDLWQETELVGKMHEVQARAADAEEASSRSEARAVAAERRASEAEQALVTAQRRGAEQAKAISNLQGVLEQFQLQVRTAVHFASILSVS